MFVRHEPGAHPLVHAAPPHPTAVVETRALAMGPEEAPALWYVPRVSQGLSQVQLEALMLACQSHETFLPPGERERQGFCLGDGTGVGKSRVLAALFAERWLRRGEAAARRLRGLWISVSADLGAVARREMAAVGGAAIPFECGGRKGARPLPREGLLFCTYMELARRNEHAARVREWIARGDDCVLLFDESHRAKCTTQAGGGSRTAAMMLSLQRDLPHARVVYSSATGAQDVRSMLHMERLGLWGGDGRVFRRAADFDRAMRRAGLGAMEMLARELRQRGLYVSRQLDTSSLRVRIEPRAMGEALESVYNDSVWLWHRTAGQTPRCGPGALVKTQQQRFFRTLMTAAKVPHAIELAEARLREGSSVVFVLQSTGESSLRRGCADAGLAEALRRAVCAGDLAPPGSGAPLDAAVRELAARLPLNPLDQLLHHFGSDRVAEISGRVYRLAARGSGAFERRALDNQAERQLFMSGRKRVAVLTASGSSGISLHDSLESDHPAKRVMIILETPWSPTAFVQQVGRVHRSNQRQPPEIVLMALDDVPAEQRFTATLYQRLQVLGALTGGDRGSVPHTRRMGDRFGYADSVARGAVHDLIAQFTLRRLALALELGAAAEPGVPDLPPAAARRALGLPPRSSGSQAALVDAVFQLLLHMYRNPARNPFPARLARCDYRSSSSVVMRFGAVLALQSPPPMASAASPWRYYDPQQLHVGADMSAVPYVGQLQETTAPVSPALARCLWDRDRYAALLARTFVAAGGHLPAHRWSPGTHRQFPEAFQSGIEAVRPRVPPGILDAVCQYACNWYSNPPDPFSDMVELQLRGPVSAVTTEMWFNAMLSAPLEMQRLYFRQVSDLCGAARRCGAVDPGLEGLQFQELALQRESRWGRGRESVRLLDFSALPVDHTLPWELAQARVSTEAGCDIRSQRRSKRLYMVARQPQRWHLWSVSDRRRPFRSAAPADMERWLAEKFDRVGRDDPGLRERWEKQRRAIVPRHTRLLLLVGSLLRWWVPLHSAAGRASLRAVQASVAGGGARYTGLRVPPILESRVRSLLRKNDLDR